MLYGSSDYIKKIIPLLFLGLILITGCVNNQPKEKEEVKKTAERFARDWEQKNFDSMYNLFIPELKEKRTKEDFVNFFKASEKDSNIVIRLDKVSIDSKDVAYAYYTISGSIYEAKAPAMKLEHIENNWRFNAFADFFVKECAEECIDYYRCKRNTCSSETEFKCKYEDIEQCSCEDDLDCPFDRPLCLNDFCSAKQCFWDKECEEVISQKKKDDCESKGLRFNIEPWCFEGECKSRCYESPSNPVFRNPQEEDEAKLKIRISQIDKTIEIKNYDVDLTKITILINNKFKKELDSITSGSELILSTSEFLDNNNKNLGSSNADNFYLYSQQGKWWN